MHHCDRVLEGVCPGELEHLTMLSQGRDRLPSLWLEPLEAKGWVEVAHGEPLLTIAGRTLVDHDKSLAERRSVRIEMAGPGPAATHEPPLPSQ